MNINVGPKARIVGTRRVSKSGQLGGLDIVAGREVFIVAPTRTPRVLPSVDDYVADARKLLKTEAKRAVAGVRELRKKLEKSLPPASSFLANVAPPRAKQPIRRAEAWIRATGRRLEKRLGKAVLG